MGWGHQRRWLLAAVIVVGVGARVGYAVYVEETDRGYARTPDSESYTESARALTSTGRFETAPDSGIPQYIRTPGYPAFVAAVYLVTDESDLGVLVAQALLGAGTMLLVFALVRAFGGSFAVALAGVVLVALDPLQFTASARLHTESLSAFLVTAAAYCGVRMIRSRFSVAWALALGAALTAATFVRPSMYYFVALISVGLALHALRRPGLRRVVLAAAVATLVPALVLVGAWQVRNHETVGSWRFSGVEGVNMYWFRAAAAVSEAEGTSLRSVQRRLTKLLNEDLDLSPRRLRTLDRGALPRERADEQGEYFDRAYDEGLALLVAEPGGALVMTVKGFARTVGGPRDLIEASPTRVLFGVLTIGFYVLAAVGVVMSARRRWGPRLPHVLCLGLIAYVLVVSAGAEGVERFRIPVMPLLAAYAALGVGTLVERRGVSREPADTMPWPARPARAADHS